jgi:hypothetical protein
MIALLQALCITVYGLCNTAAFAQTLSSSLPAVDAQTEAAIYHAAGNTTQVPSDITITSPTEAANW